jgi:hypothetical protein
MGREMQRVFARSARTFQHKTGCGQMAPQDFRDRRLVARYRWCEAPCIF